MKRLILNYHFWLLGIFSMIFNSCSTKYKVISENSGTKKIYNLKYGEDKRNTMDVFLPEKYSSETPIAVSYTHLDVYKRQILTNVHVTTNSDMQEWAETVVSVAVSAAE